MTLSGIVIAICAVNVVLRNFYWTPLGGGGALLKGWLIQSGFQIFTNVLGIFGSPAKGLFVFAPILIAILWAIPRAFQTNRDIAVFATLILLCTIGFLSILKYTTDETWGSRYLHVTIAPLLLCIGAAWPTLRWRVHVPLAVLAGVGIVISFLGAFFYYGARGQASDVAGQNTMEWLTSDPLWNEVVFDARLFEVWRHGGSDPVPWTPTHLWVWTQPPDAPSWRAIDLRKYADPQSFLLYHWNRQIEASQQPLFTFYLNSLFAGLLLLCGTSWASLGVRKHEHPLRAIFSQSSFVLGLVCLAVVTIVGVWIEWPAKSQPKLILDKTEVVAGQGDYTMKIADMPNENVVVRYSIDGAAPGEMTALLDANGAVHFDVQETTPRGVYRMLAFKRKQDLFWLDTDAAITVK